MNSEKLKFWSTLIANLGVILGLLFLILEIRQSSSIAVTQTRMEFASGWRDVDSARQDASFAALLAKSYDNPEALSIAEVIQLDGYYWGVVDQMLSAQVAWNSGVRDGSFAVSAEQVAATYFRSRFAQAWWQHVRDGFSAPENAEFRGVMDRAIEKVRSDEYPNPYRNVMRDITSPYEADSD